MNSSHTYTLILALSHSLTRSLAHARTHTHTHTHTHTRAHTHTHTHTHTRCAKSDRATSPWCTSGYANAGGSDLQKTRVNMASRFAF